MKTWKRPTRELWLITALVLLLLSYLGLILGGYLPVPKSLQGLAELWWNHL